MTVTNDAALVALGANLPGPSGGPEITVMAAVAALEAIADGPVRTSRLFATPAYPPGSGPDFVNAAAAFRWRGSAKALLAALHRIEACHGRTRDRRWEPRLLDLDLLAHGQTVLPDPGTEARWRGLPPETAGAEAPEELILPHPRLSERAFVLVPLAEVAPDWRHPATGLDVAAMLDALPAAGRAAIRPM
ncbi:2-amino-4-hydroxy-6-hydroxymethyldihydropteridine diphosphokinase [Rhodobacterales bacterium HKCCE2091]|nr:2-amino-4-hydroxy-6-hydroxymethyldihydropteridine diphosphokinase [Rhodobacterales bacterium HKCCE2091]